MAFCKETSITSLFVCMIIAIKKFEWKQKLNNYFFNIFDQLMFGLCRKSTLCNGYVLSKIFSPCLALIVRFGTQKLFWTNSLPLSSIENITEYYWVLPLSTNIESHKIWDLTFFKILEFLLGITFYPGKQQNDSGTKISPEKHFIAVIVIPSLYAQKSTNIWLNYSKMFPENL